MANELSSLLHSKASTPKSATSDLAINVLDCPTPKTYSSKKCNLLNVEVNKLENISSLQSNLSDRLTHLLPNDSSPTSAAEFKSTKKCNLNNYKMNKNSPSLENHSSNESTNSDLYHQIVDILTIQKQDFYNCLAEVDEKLNKPLLKSKNSTNGTSLSKRLQSAASLIEPSKKKKAISLYGDLSSTKQLPLSASPKKLRSSHICTKLKAINLPFLLCDCNNPNSSSNINTDILSLGEEINNYTSTVVSMAKKNPQRLQSLVSDSTFYKKVQKLFLPNDTENNCEPPNPQHLKTHSPIPKIEICNSSLDTSSNNADLEADIQIQSRNCNWESKHDIQNHSGVSDSNYKELPNDNENNCAQPNTQHLKRNSPTSKNEICDLLDTSHNTDLEADAQNHSGASDFNYKESESVLKQTLANIIQEQNVTFLQNSLKHINFTSNYCITELFNDYVGSIDAFEQKASVKFFCEDPQTVEVLSKFLSDIETSSDLSSIAKLQYEFPVNFQDLSLLTVIKGYIKCFIFKIFPLNCEAITSQSVLHFANENMSALEKSAAACFFTEAGLLKPTDFISRFTYVAIVVIYKEYQRRRETFSS